MTASFGYLTYPPFNIAWDEHSLGAILLRLLYATGKEHQRLVWCAAFLASENGYEVHAVEEGVDITLPTGIVILETDADCPLTPSETESIKAFCEQQLADLPKPPEDAMRYGEAPYELPKGQVHE